MKIVVTGALPEHAVSVLSPPSMLLHLIDLNLLFWCTLMPQSCRRGYQTISVSFSCWKIHHFVLCKYRVSYQINELLLSRNRSDKNNITETCPVSFFFFCFHVFHRFQQPLHGFSQGCSYVYWWPIHFS